MQPIKAAVLSVIAPEACGYLILSASRWPLCRSATQTHHTRTKAHAYRTRVQTDGFNGKLRGENEASSFVYWGLSLKRAALNWLSVIVLRLWQWRRRWMLRLQILGLPRFSPASLCGAQMWCSSLSSHLWLWSGKPFLCQLLPQCVSLHKNDFTNDHTDSSWRRFCGWNGIKVKRRLVNWLTACNRNQTVVFCAVNTWPY